jgi:hypothetical protein
MASLVSVIEIETKLSELHYVQVLLAICRGCFHGKMGHNFKTKKQPILRLKKSILTELLVPSYV